MCVCVCIKSLRLIKSMQDSLAGSQHSLEEATSPLSCALKLGRVKC